MTKNQNNTKDPKKMGKQQQAQLVCLIKKVNEFAKKERIQKGKNGTKTTRKINKFHAKQSVLK